MWTPAHREKYRYDDRRYPSDLTDAEWEAIKVIFSGYTTLTVDLREMVNACFYLERTGCPWPCARLKAMRVSRRRGSWTRKVLYRLRKKVIGDSTGTKRSRA